MEHITRNKQPLIYVACFMLLVLLDQISKVYFSHRSLLSGFISPTKNYGLPFGLNFGEALNFLVIIIAAVLFAWYFWTQKKNNTTNISLVLIFAGAVSNVVDRVMFGYVRDFINLGLGFTFNLADSFIVAGLIMIVIWGD